MATFLLNIKTVHKHYCFKKNGCWLKNNPIKIFLVGLLSFTYWTGIYAADFVVNNISYDVVSMSDLTCEVASGTYPINGKIEIPATVTFKDRTFTVIGIGDDACKDKYYEDVTFPYGIQYIGKGAFEGNNLKKIVIPGSVTTIKASAFHWNNITVENMKTIYNPIELVLEDSDEELVGNKDDLFQWLPFSDCNLEKIYIGRNINKQLIADQIVTLTKEIEIGDKVKELTTDRLNNNMFKHFYSLEKVIIGKKLRVVPYFDEGDNMKEVYVKTTEPQESEGFNTATYMNATLYVPEGTVSKYQQTSPWSGFFEIKEWDGKTGIKKIELDNKEGSKHTYDVNGRKVDNNQKGIIIRNGKKYINN